MSRSRVAAAAAALAAAAAVAVSGCTTVVDGVATAGRGAGEKAAVETASAPPPSPWVDVTGQGAIDYTDLPQVGLRPAPGIALSFFDPEGQACTIGPGTDKGYLTAGHCTAGGTGVMTRAYLAASAHDQHMKPAGWITGASTAPGNDSALFENSVPGDAAIAGTWPVAGVLTVDGVKGLPHGSAICFDGSESGVRCGTMIDTADEQGFRFDARTQGHDSGAPVFLVDRHTRAATLIGLLWGHQGSTAVATYLDPQLERLGVEIITDPAVAVPVSTPGYSNRVKEQ